MAIPAMKSSILSPFRAEDDNNLTRRACQTNLTLDSGSRGHRALAKHRYHQCSDQLGSQLCPHNFDQTQQTGRRSIQTRGEKSSKEKCCDFLCQLPPETIVCAMGVVLAEVNLTYHIQTLLKVFSHANDSFERKEQMRKRGNSHHKTVIQKRPTRESHLLNSKEIPPMTITHSSSGSHKTNKAEKETNISNNTFVSKHSKPEESEDSVHENKHNDPTGDFAFLEDPAVPSCRDVSKGSPSDRSSCRREFFLPAFLLWVIAFSLPCVALADPGRIL